MPLQVLARGSVSQKRPLTSPSKKEVKRTETKITGEARGLNTWFSQPYASAGDKQGKQMAARSEEDVQEPVRRARLLREDRGQLPRRQPQPQLRLSRLYASDEAHSLPALKRLQDRATSQSVKLIPLDLQGRVRRLGALSAECNARAPCSCQLFLWREPKLPAHGVKEKDRFYRHAVRVGDSRAFQGEAPQRDRVGAVRCHSWVSLCSSGCSSAHFVTQVGLELTTILLPQPPECWDYRCEPPCRARMKTQSHYGVEAGLNSQRSSCLSLPSAGITGTQHYSQLPSNFVGEIVIHRRKTKGRISKAILKKKAGNGGTPERLRQRITVSSMPD
ncbi:protein max isoform X3 [Cavia porcellus]|uniref:protein max isoform X3 n=1 Tax=Cavia porcellus TaxID=10141 RepID=UPI002FE0C045